ncbi:MAG TPA: AAA family ATPase [Candidatus Woesebacteria bacterium]|nr:AAA family ATPase [Candidatus Woesebacteria bacterium]
MYLKQIAIINYKSCRDLVLEFNENLPNTFIGRTDAGKSTILKAVGLLLDEKSFPNMIQEGHETSDISTTPIVEEKYKKIFEELGLPFFDPGTDKSIILVAIFSKQDGDFEGDFDDIASNHLKWSIESYSADNIAIIRQFNNQYPNGRYLLCSKEDTTDKKELWKQNQTTLDNLIKKLKITKEDITNDNKTGRFKNVEKFRAIYNRLKTSDQWSPYDEFGKKDRKFFPIYRYIDWREITLKSVEEMARDTMSTVVEEYSTKLKGEADRLGKEATEKVNTELEKKISKILAGMPTVTAIKARVFFRSDETISEISVEKGTSDGSVRLESQGDGVKKQIGFAFMRLAALEGVTEEVKTKKFLWGFDEPEAHLYPPEKRDFYETIKQLSGGVFQTFISTHSTVFVDKSQIETIRKVQLDDKYTTVSMCSSVTDVHESLGIRNSDFLFYDIFIAGEGDSDQILIPYFYKLYFDRTFEDDSVQFVCLGGGHRRTENKKLFEQMLKDFKDPNDCVYYVLDKDTNASGSNVYLVGAFDIEDSIEDKFWLQLVKDKCGIELTAQDLKDIRGQLAANSDQKFHKLLGDKIAGTSSKKDFLPSKTDCAKYMTTYILDKKDIPGDIIKLFEAIKKNGK